ncbi:16S rRNA (cytidine(1402)-2'-O)-methyltransferase [Candidatus Magnetobacterium casense]|uniref:16S rRNA (cytidine(1402)-2'-O)-methyltransferase n=1 Tax=Candidatus Magnetobacterium casense TaxID=1455061 RepID=UPI00058AE090|nr:16S rRNA (cytidine(1402)-2'-O)-methyltransferase [Candidatus Magnetobacterium casensis]
MKGVLYIVSTPIGNLQDITLRALDTLKEVDVIAAEDTRHSAKLLNHYGITTPMISYWGEKEKVKSREVLQRLNDGLSVALISDAGTPGVSDPGEVLVREALTQGIEIVPIPGATSLITALSVSGLSTKRYFFAGFLSSRQTQRIKELTELKGLVFTVVFYESPHRIMDFLYDLLEVFGNRRIALCHEMTKMHEEVIRGSVQEVIDKMERGKIAGEYVVIAEAAPAPEFSMEDALREVDELIKAGSRRKDAVMEVATAMGIDNKQLYKESLQRDSECSK